MKTISYHKFKDKLMITIDGKLFVLQDGDKCYDQAVDSIIRGTTQSLGFLEDEFYINRLTKLLTVKEK